MKSHGDTYVSQAMKFCFLDYTTIITFSPSLLRVYQIFCDTVILTRCQNQVIYRPNDETFSIVYYRDNIFLNYSINRLWIERFCPRAQKRHLNQSNCHKYLPITS